MNFNRLPSETMQQYRGRQKREMNDANDALNLQVGEPVQFGNRKARFEFRMFDRMRPTRFKRLEGEELTAFLEAEKEKQAERETREREAAERITFYDRPEVKDADAVRYILEDRLKLVIDCLTPAEWSELRKRLES